MTACEECPITPISSAPFNPPEAMTGSATVRPVSGERSSSRRRVAKSPCYRQRQRLRLPSWFKAHAHLKSWRIAHAQANPQGEGSESRAARSPFNTAPGSPNSPCKWGRKKSDAQTAHVPGASSQSLGRGRIGEGAEATKCEPRFFAAGPNVERSSCIGCSQIASTEPFMQLGAVDQRRIPAVRTQRNRLREVRY